MAAKKAPRQLATSKTLPDKLKPLAEIAQNLWWCWDADALELFASIDPGRWETLEHSPVALLRRLPDRTLLQLQDDETFLKKLRRVHNRLKRYLRARTWHKTNHGAATKGVSAYFSMEFAIHESLPIFAGGLGVLAGDHFKSASDLGLPLVGVGIFWNRGYVRQRIDAAGNQSSVYDRLKPDNMPLTEVKGPNGKAILIDVPLGEKKIKAKAWRLDVGRVPIYLLDTNLSINPPKDRTLTNRLYSGDRDTRVRQEVLLGIGGWRLLRALKVNATACHLNEGHAAFCAVERMAEMVASTGCTTKQAASRVASSTVFTTHTPVPAGNETFAPNLVEKYLAPYCKRANIDFDSLMSWSRVDPQDDSEDFGMTPLALRLSKYRNGVSKLHGKVSQKMWQGIWPKKTANQVPIGSITNGVHTETWMHPAMARLLDEHLRADWRDTQDSLATWKRVDKIDDGDLWDLHQSFKADLVEFVRERLQNQLRRQGASQRKINQAAKVLDPEALTIGFARRFAPYKRATLIFTALGKLDRIVNSSDRPVQIVFAGKAHPADTEGQALVKEIAKHSQSPKFRNRIVLLEDYDMHIARKMVAGVDVWLNNPRRPQEASGTSGMKPALHGGLNLSILDGWWPEVCDGRNGWAIGSQKDHDGTKAGDKRDAAALFERLTKDVIPLYYDRNRTGLPAQWIKRMKHALMTIPPTFSSHRMVKEYYRKYYAPVMKRR